MNLIGDVKGKVAVMVDDMIDTAGESSWFQILIQDKGKLKFYLAYDLLTFQKEFLLDDYIQFLL